MSGGSDPFRVRWFPPIWGGFLREGNISELLGFTAARGWVEAQVGTDDLVLYSSRICVYKSWRRVDLSKADEVGIYTGQLKEVLFFLSVRRHDIWTP